MDKNFGVVDIKGFDLPEKFVPIEVAIVTSMRSYCFEVSLSKENQALGDPQTINYLTKQVHGLKFCQKPKGIKESEIEHILLSIYKECKSRSRKYFACKSHQTLKILQTYNFPCIDLNQSEIPDVDTLLQNENLLCHRHVYRVGNIRCALYKADKLWSLVSSYQYGILESTRRFSAWNNVGQRKINLPSSSYTFQ
jgi:hypothetical protein